MRVYMKKNITAYSGKDQVQDVVYRSLNKGAYCIAAEFTPPKNHPQHAAFSANCATLKTIWDQVSSGYKTNLRTYAEKISEVLYYEKNQLRVSCYSVFVKLIYAYAKLNNSEVSTLVYDTIKTTVLKTLSDAIDANLLDKVDGYGELLGNM